MFEPTRYLSIKAEEDLFLLSSNMQIDKSLNQKTWDMWRKTYDSTPDHDKNVSTFS